MTLYTYDTNVHNCFPILSNHKWSEAANRYRTGSKESFGEFDSRVIPVVSSRHSFKKFLSAPLQ